MEQLEEVTVRERSVDSRPVIEAKGKHIVLSEIKSCIEQLFNISAVEEVRIYAGKSLTIDAEFCRDVWHGKNVVVLAKEIKVPFLITWDVSGNDSHRKHTAAAGTDPDGHGRDGNDGYAGESGGNVTVMANLVHNPERWTIISKGGDGSKGQDGGDGKAGADGKGISRAEFAVKFPPCAMVPNRREGALKNMKSIINSAKIIRSEWLARGLSKSDICTNDTLSALEALWHPFFDVYLDVVTKEGCEIIFSLYFHSTVTQSFLLYKGSRGQPGKSGGRYGLGGQGGLPGEIVVKHMDDDLRLDIKTYGKWGNDGYSGKGGLNGAHGKSGCDMGVMDYMHFKPVYYGQDEDSTLELSYHEKKASNRVYCPYKERTKDYAYAEFSEARIHQPSTVRERNNTRARNERQPHSKAIAKKPIPSMSVLTSFNEFLQEMKKKNSGLKKTLGLGRS